MHVVEVIVEVVVLLRVGHRGWNLSGIEMDVHVVVVVAEDRGR